MNIVKTVQSWISKAIFRVKSILFAERFFDLCQERHEWYCCSSRNKIADGSAKRIKRNYVCMLSCCMLEAVTAQSTKFLFPLAKTKPKGKLETHSVSSRFCVLFHGSFSPSVRLPPFTSSEASSSTAILCYFWYFISSLRLFFYFAFFSFSIFLRSYLTICIQELSFTIALIKNCHDAISMLDLNDCVRIFAFVMKSGARRMKRVFHKLQTYYGKGIYIVFSSLLSTHKIMLIIPNMIILCLCASVDI